MNKTIHLLLLLVLATALLAGCKKEVDKGGPQATDKIELAKGTLLMPGTDYTDKVSISTNVSTVKVTVPHEASSWLSASATRSEVTIKVKASDLETERSAELTFLAGTARAKLLVKQASIVPSVVTSESAVRVEGKSEKTFRIPIIANVPFIVDIPQEADAWLSYKGEEVKARSMIDIDKGERTLLFATTKNTSSDKSREAIVTFRMKDGTKKELGSFKVLQDPFGTYEGKYEDAIEEDFKRIPSDAKASNLGQKPDDKKEGGIRLSYDGNYETIYHSTWNSCVSGYWPITVEYFFKDKPSMDYIVYQPRRSGNDNGNITKMDVLIKAEGKADYEMLRTVTRNPDKEPTRIPLGKLYNKVEAVKFVIHSGAGDNGCGFVAIAEMEFYQTNPKTALPLNIFTDETVSELRPGVTEADVEKIKSGLFHDIALHMLRGTYPREYRIADYKAWPRPEDQAWKNRQSPLSLLDNPTGIYARDNEELYVFVGDTHGRKISLMLVNLDAPDGDGFGGRRELPLREGANKIKVPNKGQLYVMYHTKEYKDAKPIRIHFASGLAQGYYDSTKDPVEKYQRLLDAAPQDGYFDIVGKRAHLAFPVKAFRQYAPGKKGKELIDLYDDKVEREERFQGHYKYNRVNVNRAYYHVMYHAFMYSSSYHTAYNVGTLSGILNPDVLKKSPWGPAHELGHSFQVRPNLLWRGMTEVTVNIEAMNIQTSWNPSDSRIQQESMRGEGGFVNRYDKAYNRCHVAQQPFCLTGDVFCQLIPFWQIQLYYARVKGRSDVYMDIYERMRTAEIPKLKGNPKPGTASFSTGSSHLRSVDVEEEAPKNGPNDNGQIQLNFYRDVSKIVGEDLWDFFEFWGFFKPVDKMIEDYSTELLRVTPEMVEKVRKEVQAMGLPKPAMPVQYICDANWTYYRDQKAITKGGPAKIQDAGRRLVVPKTWKYYVAIEVKDASGNLIGLANNNEVVIHNSHKVTKECKAYAIDYSGKRTPITIE